MGRSKKNAMHDDKWIQKAVKHPGALRNTLHVKDGQNIPQAKLTRAMHSRSPLTKERANLANTLRKLHKKSS